MGDLDDIDPSFRPFVRQAQGRVSPILQEAGFGAAQIANGRRGGSGMRTVDEVSVLFCGSRQQVHELAFPDAGLRGEDLDRTQGCVDLNLAMDKDAGTVSVSWDGPALYTRHGLEISSLPVTVPGSPKDAVEQVAEALEGLLTRRTQPGPDA